MYFLVQLVFISILYARTFGQLLQSSVIEATIDPTTKTWSEASASGDCQLAAGTQSTGVSLNALTFSVINSSYPTTEAWIGATATYSAWIELQSCNLGKEIDTTYRYDISTSADPVETCLIQCGGSGTFYLTSQWCYCPASVTYSEITNCAVKLCQGDRPCGEDVQIFGQFTYNCMCRYDTITLTTDSAIGGCKKVVHGDETLQIVTADCAEENPVLCANLINGNQYIPGGLSKSWGEAVNLCNVEGAIIVGTEGARVPFDGDFVYWIGVFRIAHIVWETALSGIPEYCVSATIDANGTATKALKSCSTPLPSLCETTPSSTVSQTVSQGQTTSAYTTSGSSQDTTMDSSTQGQNNTSDAGTQASSDKTGLIVGLVLAVFAFLVIVALTQYFITKRRRQQKEKEKAARLGSIQRLPHSLRKAGEENKLSIMESGNNAHIYNDLHELKHSNSGKSDMYDHVQTGRASMNLYSELNKDVHRQNEAGTSTYDTMASINAEKEAAERAQASIPPSEDNMYSTLKKD